MKSKENQILELFFQFPTREWHFEQIIKEVNIARSKADAWLKKFIRKKLIKRIKKNGKMPYYLSNFNSQKYKNHKRIYALKMINEAGLLDHLGSLLKVKTVILFGSFSRSDWYKDSDIDIFIYGDPEGLRIVDFEIKLQRDIQLFICDNKNDIINLGEGLIRNIIKGDLIKGNLDFIEVSVNA